MSNNELVEDSVLWSLYCDDVLTQVAFRIPLQGKQKMPCM
jgi:hypothetical protein